MHELGFLAWLSLYSHSRSFCLHCLVYCVHSFTMLPAAVLLLLLQDVTSL